MLFIAMSATKTNAIPQWWLERIRINPQSKHQGSKKHSTNGMPVDSSTTDTFIDSIPEPTSVSGINGALPAVFAAPSSLFLTFVSGWFLISFVKELRMLVHEVGDAVENGLGDLDGGKSRRMGKGHDLEDTDSFMNPASPVIEGLIARLCPPAKPAVEAWTGMPPKPEGGPCQIQTFQDSYQKKSQSFRRRKKTKDVKVRPSEERRTGGAKRRPHAPRPYTTRSELLTIFCSSLCSLIAAATAPTISVRESGSHVP